MDSLGHTARGLFVSLLVLTAVIAATLGVVRRWPLAAPVSPTRPIMVERKVNDAPPSISQVDERIRVALTRRPARSVELRIDGPFRIVSLVADRVIENSSQGLPVTRVGAEGGALLIGERPGIEGGVVLIPEQSPGLWMNGRQYRGDVRLHIESGNRIWPVNVLMREEYLAAVVDSEMPAAFPDAARQAQAIVARSYAVDCQQHPAHRWFDLFATPVSQNYLGVVYRDAQRRLLAGETPAGRAAVEATADVVCTCDGRLFRTYYSACCGGSTLSGEAVFGDQTTALASVDCGACESAPLYRWERTPQDVVALERLARTRRPSFGSVESATMLQNAPRPGVVAISDGRFLVNVPAAEVKSALGLPSLMFRLDGDPEKLKIRGRGHGHGVGLCQWGAKGLAERGATAEQILQHYYPGSELTHLP